MVACGSVTLASGLWGCVRQGEPLDTQSALNITPLWTQEQVGYPWLYIHTHPAVQKYPELPSGISQENTRLSGDLYVLRNEPNRQIGIMTIGVNSVIANFRNAPQPIPFSLAIRDPLKAHRTMEKPPILASHKSADTALRLIFRRPTVSGYYIGDLRTGRAAPYLSAREQRN